MGQLDGLPNGAHTKPTTKNVVPPLGVGGVETFVVQTFRDRELGDYIFLQHFAGGGLTRLVIPPDVAEVIARQRDVMTRISRSRAGKERAARDKAAGIRPGFMKSKAGA